MNILKTLYQENRFIIVLGMCLVIASAIANVATINFINQAIATEGEFIRNHTWMIVLILLAAFGFGVSSQMIMTHLGYRVIYQLREKLLRQVLNTEYEALEEIGRNRIYATITKDIRSLQEGFIMLPFFMYAITMAGGGLIYMFSLHIGLASIAVGSLVLATLLARYLSEKFHHLIRKDRELEDDLFSAYEDMLDGHKELLLNESRGDSMLKSVMQGPALQSMVMRTLADRYIVVNIHFMTTLILFQIVLVFWLVFAFNLGGLAMATSFALTLMFIRQPLNMAMNQLGPILIARVSLRKIQSLHLGEVVRPTLSASNDWQTLSLSNVQYQYAKDTSGFQLGPINLTIQQGETLFLVGHNGAGKTSLIRLILGLTRPTQGQVLIDGQPLVEDSIRDYRSQFSAVLADFHLFAQVDAVNPEVEALVDHWLDRLDLTDKVGFEGGQFTTTSLSTGQRKRLAMVSAVAEQRKTMILDEWAADQDPSFRERFYLELLPELKKAGYTLVVVSHDDRFFHIADRLLHLDNGRVIATEAPSELQTVT